jgi:hypothetical protein
MIIISIISQTLGTHLSFNLNITIIAFIIRALRLLINPLTLRFFIIIRFMNLRLILILIFTLALDVIFLLLSGLIVDYRNRSRIQLNLRLLLLLDSFIQKLEKFRLIDKATYTLRGFLIITDPIAESTFECPILIWIRKVIMSKVSISLYHIHKAIVTDLHLI